ncbi:hypothetical protein B0H21DRAFT_723239 [Amylocystis lapponica]|nr:hypothetical protein B0H21DRAFT_723239 [Amylocystis lapponica]
MSQASHNPPAAVAAVDEPSAYFLDLAEPLGLVSDPQGVVHASERDSEDHDIYRGDPPSPPRSPSPSSVTSSSSSASSVAGGRLGAISAVLENAISRWARAWASSSSLETTSSSSDVSIATMTKSQMARRRKRRSVADLHNARSEREIAARLRAREESRYIPRAFDLYVPPTLDIGMAADTATAVGSERQQRHVLHTPSLPILIHTLGDPQRPREATPRPRRSAPSQPMRSSPPILHHDYMMPEELAEQPQDVNGRRRVRKGKHRAVPLAGGNTERLKKAWWLDVSSPTWEDMRAIGKAKFPKLGYHFITRDRYRTAGEEPDRMVDDSDVGEVNVYLVVFREGICSFHFADIAEHVDRVRTRIMKLAENINTSSDWIAHGVMDSIVDSVFPLLDKIEKEVDVIETLVVSDHDLCAVGLIALQELSHDNGTRSTSSLAEKIKPPSKAARRGIRFSLPVRVSRVFGSLGIYIKGIYRLRAVFKKSPTDITKSTVLRMARTRRLVTSLAQRLLATGEWGIGNGADNDMFVYMGDVQDHIITLQQSLAHYERVLSQSHPTYLSHLRLTVSKAQAGTDRAFVTLSTVSLGVLCVQTLIGLNSMNITIPSNNLQDGPFYVFGIVLVASFAILLVFGAFVRHLLKNSRKKSIKYF